MANNCPSVDVLKQWLVPSATESFRSQIAAHVQSCDPCRGILLAIVRAANTGPAELDSTAPKGATTNLEPTIIGTETSCPSESAEPPAPLRIGNYDILRELARGGMGVVFQARQRGINRLVALKTILSGQLAGRDEIKRFQAEAEAAGRLDHPNIVPIFDVGEHNGQPYFSMGYVDGESLSSVLRGGPIDPTRAARLMWNVSDAVHYAHGRGIIHRDLKPGNVMLDRQGQPRVTDFGLAKQTCNAADVTTSGDVLGTPSYMPPEQAQGRTYLVDARSDVYSLGATLYCLLTGRPPFQAANVMDTLWQVIHVEPVPIRQFNPEIPADLETICLKALQKDRDRRYQTAADLADELGRFLRREPILACPIGRVERIIRWCRRQPLLASLGIVTVVSLIVGMSATTYYGRMATNRANEADAARKQSILDADAANKARDEATQLARSEGLAKSEALRQLSRAELTYYAGLVQEAERDLREQDFDRAQSKLDACRWDLRNWEHDWLNSHLLTQCRTRWFRMESIISALSPDGNCLATGSGGALRLWDLAGDPVAKLVIPVESIGRDSRLEFSNDCQRVALYYTFNGGNKLVGLWSVSDGKPLLNREDSQENLLDSERLLLLSISREKTDSKRTWTIRNLAEDPSQVETFYVDEAIVPLSFTPQGDTLLCVRGEKQETLHLLELDGFRERWSIPHHRTDVTLSPDGRYFARREIGVAGYEIVRLADAETVTHIPRQAKAGSVTQRRISFSANGDTAVICEAVPDSSRPTETASCYVWDVATGQLRFSVSASGERDAFVFDADGSELLFREPDRGVVVRNTHTGEVLREITNGALQPQEMTLSPSGRLVAVSYGGVDACQVYEIASGRRAFSLPGSKDLRSIRFTRSDHQITASEFRRVATYEILPPLSRQAIKGHTGDIRDVCFHPDSRRLATAAKGDLFRDTTEPDNTVRIWDCETGMMLSCSTQSDGATAVCFSPDGTLLASSSSVAQNAPSVVVSGVTTGKEALQLSSLPPGGCRTLQFSPDQSKLIGATNIGVITWDTKTGTFFPTNWPDTSLVRVATFLGNSHTVAIGSSVRIYSTSEANLSSGIAGRRTDNDPELRILDLNSDGQIAALDDHGSAVHDIRISPDGKWIASGSRDGTIIVWDGTTYKRVSKLSGHQHTVCRVRWTPDSRRLITAGADRTIRFWDPASGVEVFRINSEAEATDREWVGNETIGFDVSPDGRRIAIGGDRGRLRVWTKPPAQEILRLSGSAKHLVWAGNESLVTSDGSMLDAWDTASGQLSNRVAGTTFFPNRVAVDSMSRVFLVAPDLRQWDLHSGTEILKLEEAADRRGYDNVAVSRDGNDIAVAIQYSGRVDVWDLKQQKRLQSFDQPQTIIQGLGFGADSSEVLIVRGRDLKNSDPSTTSSVILHHVENGTQKVLLESLQAQFVCGARSPTQKQCVVGSLELSSLVNGWLQDRSHGTLMVIDWEDEVTVRELALDDDSNLQPDRSHASVAGVAYSPNGRLIAASMTSHSVGRDDTGRVRIYDVVSGTIVASRLLNTREISNVAFSPDGTHLAVALGSEGTAIWRIPDNLVHPAAQEE